MRQKRKGTSAWEDREDWFFVLSSCEILFSSSWGRIFWIILEYEEQIYNLVDPHLPESVETVSLTIWGNHEDVYILHNLLFKTVRRKKIHFLPSFQLVLFVFSDRLQDLVAYFQLL